MWPYRLFVQDAADPSKLHGYFSGCQGRHADIHSTLADERFAKMRSEWTSYGTWGYGGLTLGKGPSKERYSQVRGTNWFRGALMRATWDSTRLWALIPSAGGDIPGQAVTVEITGRAGYRLAVNVKVHNQTRTRTMGQLTVEVLDPVTDAPIPGFTEADCTPECGRRRFVLRGGGALEGRRGDPNLGFDNQAPVGRSQPRL